QGRRVSLRLEQPMMSREGSLDFGVLGQNGDVGRAEPLRRFALRQAVVVDALLRHDPRGFLCERTAQLLRAWIRSLAHVCTPLSACKSVSGFTTLHVRFAVASEQRIIAVGL